MSQTLLSQLIGEYKKYYSLPKNTHFTILTPDQNPSLLFSKIAQLSYRDIARQTYKPADSHSYFNKSSSFICNAGRAMEDMLKMIYSNQFDKDIKEQSEHLNTIYITQDKRIWVLPTNSYFKLVSSFLKNLYAYGKLSRKEKSKIRQVYFPVFFKPTITFLHSYVASNNKLARPYSTLDASYLSFLVIESRNLCDEFGIDCLTLDLLLWKGYSHFGYDYMKRLTWDYSYNHVYSRLIDLVTE